MGVIKHKRVTSTNDSNVEVLTCPARSMIEILQVHVVFTSTATVGNRQVRLKVQDEGDTLVSDFSAGSTQAASLTVHYVFARGVYRETAVVDSEIHCPFPFGTVLLPSWDLAVLDNAAIDAAADDMVINIIYEETVRGDAGTIA